MKARTLRHNKNEANHVARLLVLLLLLVMVDSSLFVFLLLTMLDTIKLVGVKATAFLLVLLVVRLRVVELYFCNKSFSLCCSSWSIPTDLA